MNGKKGRGKDATHGAEPTRREEDISGRIKREDDAETPKETYGQGQTE